MKCENDSKFKSGFIALIGRPNAGKSTLLNRLLGQKLAIISNKPQTTRNRLLGIKNLPEGQIIFLDTPGIHRSKSRLNQVMVKTALATYNEVDAVCFLIEADHPDNPENDFVLETLKEVGKPVFLLINKIDLVAKGDLLPMMERFFRRRPFTQIIPISALKGDGVGPPRPRASRGAPGRAPAFPGRYDHRSFRAVPGGRTDSGKDLPADPGRNPLRHRGGGGRIQGARKRKT